MSSFTPDKDFVYPDPSFYGRTTGPYPHGPTIPSGVVASQSTDRAPAAAPIIPSTAGAIAPPSPPFAIDPVLLALPRPAPVLSPAPVLAAHNPAPTCPVSAAIHDKYVKTLVPIFFYFAGILTVI